MNSNLSYKKIFILIFVIFIFVFNLLGNNYNQFKDKIKDKNLESKYWNSYFELAKIRNISDKKISKIINQKIDYLLYIKDNLQRFKKDWIGIFLYFSDIGLSRETAVKLKYKGINLNNLNNMKTFLSILKSILDFNNQELNLIFKYTCEKNYTLENINILNLHLKQNIKKFKLKKSVIKKRILSGFSKGLDIKFILRELTGVINE